MTDTIEIKFKVSNPAVPQMPQSTIEERLAFRRSEIEAGIKRMQEVEEQVREWVAALRDQLRLLSYIADGAKKDQ